MATISESTHARHAAPAAAVPLPFQDLLRERAGLAAAHLARAIAATHRHGAPAFYSRPLRPPGGWSRPDVEGTAAAIPALLRYSIFSTDALYAERAHELAAWLAGTQLPDGAFPGGELKGQSPGEPAVWPTGCAIHGLLAAAGPSADGRYVEAAVRAGRWLVRSVNRSMRMWTRFTEHAARTPAYYTYVCAALARLWQQTQEESFREMSLLVLHGLVEDQDEAGGFRTWGADPQDMASTHTIAAMIRGLATAGAIFGGQGARFSGLARDLAARFAQDQEQRGRLAGAYDETWEADDGYTCPSGTAQMVLVWLRDYEANGDVRIFNAAMHATADLLETQEVKPMDDECLGAQPGSSPLWTGHAPLSYPTYATANFLDAAVRAHDALQRLVEGGPCALS